MFMKNIRKRSAIAEIDAYQLGHDDGYKKDRRAGYDDGYKKGRQDGQRAYELPRWLIEQRAAIRRPAPPLRYRTIAFRCYSC
jgi:flagellar biosynthesis/type III secretory pathway protein FliH